MPRISDERREARRAEIVAAARRCFARDGFHQTSMPDIAAEAGVSVGAPYRYFSGKDELIVEVAGEAFRLAFGPLEQADGASSVADLVASAVTPVGGRVAADRAGLPADVDELLRCAVQAWAELLRNETLRTAATEGFERVRAGLAGTLRGRLPAGADPDRSARVVLALLHGFVLQRTAFGLTDTDGFVADVRALLGGKHD